MGPMPSIGLNAAACTRTSVYALLIVVLAFMVPTGKNRVFAVNVSPVIVAATTLYPARGEYLDQLQSQVFCCESVVLSNSCPAASTSNVLNTNIRPALFEASVFRLIRSRVFTPAG